MSLKPSAFQLWAWFKCISNEVWQGPAKAEVAQWNCSPFSFIPDWPLSGIKGGSSFSKRRASSLLPCSHTCLQHGAVRPGLDRLFPTILLPPGPNGSCEEHQLGDNTEQNRPFPQPWGQMAWIWLCPQNKARGPWSPACGGLALLRHKT